MKCREYIYIVTGIVRIKSKTPEQAKKAIHSLLLGLEWTMDKPQAHLKRNAQVERSEGEDDDFDI